MPDTTSRVDAPLFDSAAPSEELQEILRRIDENLELRPLLRDMAPLGEALSDEAPGAPPGLPDLVDLPERLQRLRALRAPYFLTAGNGIGAWVKRLLNLPLRIYGFKQHLHNQIQVDAVDLLFDQVRALRQRVDYDDQRARLAATRLRQIEQQFQLLDSESGRGSPERPGPASRLLHRIRTLERAQGATTGSDTELPDRLAAQEAQLRALGDTFASQRAQWQATSDTLSRVAEAQTGLHQWIEQVVRTQQLHAEGQAGQHAWITNVVATQDSLAQDLRGQSDWIQLIEREVRGLQLQLRSSPAGLTAATSDDRQPRIVDTAGYRALVEAMPEGLLVNLGCGIKPKAGWINVDARELPDVAIVADVRRLPFEPGTVRTFEASHLVEHFRAHEMRTVILPYWRGLLKDGGTLTIICPDWRAMLARVQDGRLALEDFTLLTFGGQEYEGNDHFAMYTTDSLGDALHAAGFAAVTVVATDRLNGICPEMEIVATR